MQQTDTTRRPSPPPPQWRSAVDARMDELLEQKREREAAEARAPPVPRAAAEQVALKFV